jgi:molecular chaperone DnaJ
MFHFQKAANTELYEILGLDKNCTKKEIKNAYKELALKYHPDKLKGESTEEEKQKFPKIVNAYEILYDDEKRSNYDKYGMTDENKVMDFTPFDIVNVFNFMFPNKFGSTNTKGLKTPDPITIDVDLTLEEVIFGSLKKSLLFERTALLNIENNISVPQDKIKYIIFTCEKCRGTGTEINISKNKFMVIETSKPCSSCKSLGYYNLHPNKYKIGTKKCSFNYKIPKGCLNGSKIIIKDIGHINLLNPNELGDVILHIRYVFNNTDKFTVDRNMNLIYKQDITMFEAITGTDFNIIHLDKKLITISIKSSIKHDYKKIIKYRGLPQSPDKNNTYYTDLIILFNIIECEHILTIEEINLLKTTFSDFYHQNTIYDGCEVFSFE